MYRLTLQILVLDNTFRLAAIIYIKLVDVTGFLDHSTEIMLMIRIP